MNEKFKKIVKTNTTLEIPLLTLYKALDLGEYGKITSVYYHPPRKQFGAKPGKEGFLVITMSDTVEQAEDIDPEVLDDVYEEDI